MVQSISSAKLEGCHLQSPDVFITPVGKVNLPHRKVFLTLCICCGQQEQRSRALGAMGTVGVRSPIGPGECQAIREACVACFDISSCQTIN